MSLLQFRPSEYASLIQIIKSTLTLVAEPSTGGNYESFEIQRGPQGQGGINGNYQVPANKTLYITEMLMPVDSQGSIVLGYGDTAIEDGAAAPANAVGLICPSSQVWNGAGTAAPGFMPLIVKVPAGKYPYAYASDLNWTDPVPVILHGILLPEAL